MGQVAVIFAVFASTRSAIDVAYVGVAGVLPLVAFAVIGGTLADRYGRRRLMILSDLVRAGAWGGLSLFLLIAGFQLVPVLVATAVAASFFALFNPAQLAFVPRIVPKNSLAAANAILQSSNAIAGFLAFAAGGGAVAAVGAAPAIGVNAVTFLASALVLYSIAPSTDPVDTSSNGRRGFWSDLRDGFGYLRSQTGLLLLTLSAMFENFFVTIALAFVVVYAALVISPSAVVYGLLLAAVAAGSAVGPPLVHRWRGVLLPKAGTVWGVQVVLLGGVIGILVVFPNPLAATVSLFGIGLLFGLGVTTWLSAVQITVPDEMQGRYFGVDALGSVAILPLAQIVGGVAIAAYGILTTYLIATVGCLAVGALFLPMRSLREYGAPVERDAG